MLVPHDAHLKLAVQSALVVLAFVEDSAYDIRGHFLSGQGIV